MSKQPQMVVIKKSDMVEHPVLGYIHPKMPLAYLGECCTLCHTKLKNEKTYLHIYGRDTAMSLCNRCIAQMYWSSIPK